MALRLVYLLYCFEAGFFFVMVPWTRFWIANPLFTFSPSLHLLATNPYIRGLVSGYGVAHLVLGVRELVIVLRVRREERLRRQRGA